MLKQIQNSYNDSVKATELEVLRPVFDTEVLVLDELGAVKPTEWVWDTVSLILNTRYNDNRTTIITTNIRTSAAAGNTDRAHAALLATRHLGDRIGERMRSRLHEMCRIIKYGRRRTSGRRSAAPASGNCRLRLPYTWGVPAFQSTIGN